MTILPSFLILDPMLKNWLLEDIGRGDRTTDGLSLNNSTLKDAQWIAKEQGMIAGMAIAQRIFYLIDPNTQFNIEIPDGTIAQIGQVIATITGPTSALLTAERVALNIVMKLSGIATLTNKYVQLLSKYPTKLVDTRKTTPGLRLLEKYATSVGGAINHRMGLDDAVMIKDNHIAAAGGIAKAITLIRNQIPYVLSIEVETETLEQVREALLYQADIIMLDNMNQEQMIQAVELIRKTNPLIKIEASGNITEERIESVAATGVDYISTSAGITRSTWLDLSMKMAI